MTKFALYVFDSLKITGSWKSFVLQSDYTGCVVDSAAVLQCCWKVVQESLPKYFSIVFCTKASILCTCSNVCRWNSQICKFEQDAWVYIVHIMNCIELPKKLFKHKQHKALADWVHLCHIFIRCIMLPVSLLFQKAFLLSFHLSSGNILCLLVHKL